jgi:outer membrane protein OmpA-like peptidoglycan-associated protein
MKYPKWSSVGLCAALILGPAVTPRAAEAQIWKTIKEHAAKKAAEKAAEATTKVVETSNGVVDSSLTKTGRGVDTLVNKAGTVADTVMNKTEHGVASAAKSLTGRTGGGGDNIKASLAAGRLVLADLKFAPGTAVFSADGAKTLDKVAKAMLSTDVTYLLESHAIDGADATTNQTLSEQRGAAVKARLVAAGVPTARLFVMSYGATRPATSGSSNRIEIAKMQ